GGRLVERESLWVHVRGLERRQQAGLVGVALLIVAAAAFWYVRSLPSRVRVEATVSAAAPGGAGATAGSTIPSPSPGSLTPGGVVVVDVAGWVRHPGVYQLHQGDRVIDAIRRAGGPRPGADLTSINLAALLTDAEQVVVGRAGARAGPPSSVGSGAGGSGGGSGGLVNINTATLDQLETLPGIGPALGQRIVDYRTQHGPFHSVEDLLNVSGIGEKRLADIKSKVTV
ncbi:MAG TPA: ComEA family DNA-binding protein, partial [Actinomycetota bacterium]|nr:ComEA family DNA-binding protein [Actinomycetota bacterium]